MGINGYKVLEGGANYDNESLNSLTKLFENKNLSFQDDLLVSAKIIAVEENSVIVSINDKYDAVVKKSELKDLDDIKVGSYIDVFIEKRYDKKGQIVVSRSKGRIVKLWKDIYNSKKNNFIFTINVTEKVQSGIIGVYGTIRIFVPFSQINNYNDNEEIIGQELNVIVIKINKTTGNVIGSNKLVLDVKKKELENTIIDQIQEGQVVECVVSNIVVYGAFVNIGGVNFLLHINEISWKHIDNPSEVLKVGDVIKVVVLSVNKDNGRLTLSLKQLLPNPWDEVINNKTINEGDILEGKVVNIADYGIFVEVLDGIEGLVHSSEITWATQNVKTNKLFKLNDIIKVKVITIDTGNKRISLSIKQLTEDPWLSESFTTTMTEGSKHSCTVIAIKQFGCVIKLENDIEAFIHVSDFSWTQKVTNIDKFVEVGETLDVVILSIDHKLRKIACGIKQLEQNPWTEFAKEFEENSLHKGIVIKKTNKFYLLKLEHDLEGVMFKENVEQSKQLSIGSEIEVRVLEFNAEVQKLHVIDKDISIKVNKVPQAKNKKTEFTIGELTDLNKIGNI